MTGNTFTTAYTYDNANNKLTRLAERGATVTANYTYSYDNANELNHYTEHVANLTTNLTYDDAGNRVRQVNSSGNLEYDYNGENRLSSVYNNTASTTEDDYGYDYLGRRLARDQYSGTTENITVDLFDGTSPVRGYTHNLTSGSITSNATAEYIRGSDMGGGIGGILYSLHSNTPTYYGYDGRGDVTTETNSTGGITYQAAYEAFGTHGAAGTTYGTEQTGTNSDPFQYSTQEQDPAGFLVFLNRDYDQGAGVWLTRDPAGMIDGPNLYTNVGQNLWTKSDPYGLTPADFVGGLIDGLGSELVEQAQGINSAVNGPVTGYVNGWILNKAAEQQKSTSQQINHSIGADPKSTDYQFGKIGGNTTVKLGTVFVGGGESKEAQEAEKIAQELEGGAPKGSPIPAGGSAPKAEPLSSPTGTPAAAPTAPPSAEPAADPQLAGSPQINPSDLAGKSRTDIRGLANDKGLVPAGDKTSPDYPRRWNDPVSGQRRLRLDRGHVDKDTGLPYDKPNATVDHVHGYGSDGAPIEVNGDNHIPTTGE